MADKNTNRMIKLLCEKMMQYSNGNYSDFFLDNNEDFLFLLSLVYMILIKEMVITKNKKVFDISSRLKLKIDRNIIDSLISKNGLQYLCDNVNRDSIWLFDAIRDSILHDMSEIDFDNKTIYIKNNQKKLECDIPFSFFIDIAGRHFSDAIILNPNEYEAHAFVYDLDIYGGIYFEPGLKENTSLSNYDELINHIKRIKQYKVKFIPKDKDKLSPIGYDNITKWNLSDFESEINYWVHKYAESTLNELTIRSFDLVTEKRWSFVDFINARSKEFDELFCNNLKKFLIVKYPNFNFEIVPESIPLDKIGLLYNKRIDNHSDFFKRDFASQHAQIVMSLRKIYLDTESEMLLGAFNDLIVSFGFVKDIVDEKDIVAKTLAISILNGSKFDVYDIRRLRKQLGMIDDDTYDSSILHYGEIIPNLNYISFADFMILKKKNPCLGEYYSDYFTDGISLSDIKKIDETIYNKYVKMFRDTDEYSDQDLSYITKNYRSVVSATQINGMLNRYYYIMPILFLYALGTGIYSINKKRVFEGDSDFINAVSTNITCYSRSFFNSSIDTRSRLPGIIAENKEQLLKLQKDLANCSSERGRVAIKRNLESVMQKILYNESRLNNPIILVDGINYQMCDSAETMARIRDAFSHLNRIKLIDFQSKSVELVDYNDNNEPVAIIKTDIDTIFKMFLLSYNEPNRVDGKHKK